MCLTIKESLVGHKRKKQLINKIYLEGFWLAVGVGMMLIIAHTLKMDFFEDDWGILFTILISSSYVLLKEAYVDRESEINTRHTFKICMIMTSILVMFAVVWIVNLSVYRKESNIYILLGEKGIINTFVLVLIGILTIMSKGIMCKINEKENSVHDEDCL